MDKVATRARTGKASLYRRWSGPAELVADALRHELPTPQDVPDTGDLREDVLALFRRATQLLAGPHGEALRRLLIDSLANPGLHRLLGFQDVNISAEPMLEILRRAVVRGQARPKALIPLVADAGPALIRQHFLLDGAPIPDDVITAIVDDVVLPLTEIR
jgi:AcrR family transcriptional regulator